MQILHIIPSLETGGAQGLLARLLPGLNRFEGMTVRVAVGRLTGSDNEYKLRINGVEIIDLGVSLRSPRCLPVLHRVMKEADVVHVHLFPLVYFAALASRGLRKTIFFTDHSTFNRRRNHRWLRPIEKLVHSAYTQLVTVSEAGREALEKWLNLSDSSQRITVIPNGIDLNEWRLANRQLSSEVFGRQGIALLMPARFSPSKDHATVIRSLRILKRKEVFVVFAGDGPTRREMETLAAELDVADRVVFLGDRADVPDLASAASVGIISSHWEGFGLVAIEMMAAGLPVVASRVDGLRDVTAGVSLQFTPGNEDELCSQIEKILSDTEMKNKLVAAGRERSCEYSIEKTVAAHLRLYNSSLSRKSDS